MTAGDGPEALEVETPEGLARCYLHAAAGEAAGTLVLGHGAGGGTDAADLQALTALAADGWHVVLVEQPWRVAGRRVATPPPRLDRAWLAILPTLVERLGERRGALVVGGRSAGARVACRTAAEVGADGVLCLAFPLHPPGKPERTRAEELRTPLAAGLPVLVVQGERDAFGGPDEVAAATASAPGADRLRLEPVPGSHSPSRDLARVRELSRDWLSALG